MNNFDKHGSPNKGWPVGQRPSFQCDKPKKSYSTTEKMLDLFMAKPLIIAGIIGFISLLLSSAGILSNPSPIVSTENGPVQGRLQYSRNGTKYFAYLGIPYGKPPVGELRFEPPEPLDNFQWKDVRQATSYPPYCLQFDAMVRGRLFGQEDCLYLNVFTHETEKRKPVIVYIHGGGFMSGASQMYQPDFFMDHKEIVVVTLNYRLGPLGFMSIGDSRISGNMGLKDQLLVLQWVQKNIHYFGGDPNRVTLMGESAGAASVHYHMISPASKGLFHRAILQSGSVTCPWSFSKNPNEVSIPYIQSLDCPVGVGNSTELVNCLKTMDPVKLVTLQINLMNPMNDFLMFVPSAEPETAKNPFLTDNPRTLLKQGKIANPVPILMGVTSGEGALRTARLDAMPESIQQIDENWETIAPKLLVYDNHNGMYSKVADTIRQRYFGNQTFTENVHAFKKNFSKLASDALFYEPVRRAGRIHAQHGQPLYMYYYDYDSVLLPSCYSLFRSVRPDNWLFAEAHIAWSILVDLAKENLFGSEGPHDFGSTHGDDLFQVWNMEGLSGYASGFDSEFSQNLIKAFVDFALNAEPLQFNGVTWPPAQEKHDGSATPEMQYMLIGKTPKMIVEPFADRMPFWQSLKIRE